MVGCCMVLVGEGQPAAGRAGIMCGDLHQKSLQYLMDQQGLKCPYLTADPLSLLPTDIKEAHPIHGGLLQVARGCTRSSMRVASVVENLLPRFLSVL